MMRHTVAQARWELRAILRNGEQLLVSFGLPVLALVALVRLPVIALPSPVAASALAGTLAMAVLSSAFTSQAILLAFDRRWGVLRMLATTPLGPGGLVRGKAVAVVVLVVAQSVVLAALAALLGWTGTSPAGVGLLALFLALGTAAFVGLAVLVGGTLRAEAVLALANLLWLLFVAGGALLPLPEGSWLRFLPPGALGEGLRAATAGEADVPAAAVLALWAVVLGLLARRTLRWD